MKLKILPATVSDLRDCFEIKMDFMNGDGDASTSEKVEVKTKKQLVGILKMLSKVKNRPTYEDIEKYLQKFTRLCQKDLLENWPCDTFCEDYLASLEQVSVVYYDNEGIHHKVEIDGKPELILW